MKKQRAVLSGLAALTLFDLVGAQAQAQVPQLPNWTGYYVGVHTGYRWGDATGSIPDALPGPGDSFDYFQVPFAAHPGSGIFGFHAGYNFMSANWLVGFETAWSWGNGKSRFSASFSDSFDSFSTLNYLVQLSWSGSVRGRFGVVRNDWLFYGTAGVAFQHVKVSGNSQYNDSFGSDSLSIVGNLSQGKVLYGYVIGAGIERLAVGGWTWRIEYLFADFGRENFGPVRFSQTGEIGGDSFSTFDASRFVSLKLQTHTVRVGITKLFQP